MSLQANPVPQNAGPILVVSVDQQHSDVRRKILEDAGFEVVAVTDHRSLVEACKTRHFRLAIIGYSIPPAEKARIASELKTECCKGTPALELHAGEEAEIAAVAFSFVQSAKCDPKAFLETVNEICGGHYRTEQRTGT